MSANQQAGLVIYVNPEVEQLRQLIAAARARLAEVEATYTMDRRAVDATQAIIFRLARKHYQARDNLRLIIEHRERYLKALLRGGEEEAEEVTEKYEKARAQSDANYREAEGVAAKRKELTSEEEDELKTLWKKLVLLYHPDRFASQPDKIETYQKLTGVINRAKEEGDIDLLREIANDPHGFILRQGWTSLDFSDDLEIKTLRKLLATLQLEIVNMIESLNSLHRTSEYELYKLSVKQPGLLQKVADEQINAIAAEIIELETEAERLKAEIVELTGDDPIDEFRLADQGTAVRAMKTFYLVVDGIARLQGRFQRPAFCIASHRVNAVSTAKKYACSLHSGCFLTAARALARRPGAPGQLHSPREPPLGRS